MGVQRSLKSSSFSGSKLFPPGFRFHPTDEELVLYYLKRKICRRRLKPDIIAETDVYKWDPDELPELSKLKTGDRQWFFLSPRDRRYPNGGRSNRATMRGYWKATGKDRTISCNLRSVGLKKTLVYYKGRAPSGERTDWVMHEYTLDEEELKRCPSAQDYYVLYKVYKKSGPGPKNGEQYGAPFKEEDWADDECVNFSGFLDQENTVKEADVSCIDNNKANNLPQDQVDDIDEFLKNIVDETAIVPPLTIDNWYTFDQVIAEKENVSTLVDHCSGEVSLPDRSKVPHQYQHSNVQTTSDHTQSLTSQLPIEAHEVVASATKNCEQGLGEILFEDFLEMDDLLGPQPSVPNSEKPPETLPSNGIVGLVEAELYNDVTIILRDMGQGGPAPVSQPYLPNPDSGMSNVASNSYLNTVENEAANHHAQPFHYEANPMSSELWAPEQRFNLFTPEENQAAFSHPISGTRVIDNQSYTEDDGTFSWLSQWLESIPTTPASASESALVNKDFDWRFSLGRLKTKNANPTTISRRRGQKFIGGMFSFSVIGIVCAILWVLIGTFVKLLGRYVSLEY